MVSASDGQILWYSEKFISETGEDSLRNLKNVRQFNSEILSSRVTKVSFSDKYFNVYLDLCVLNDREMYVLYFIDVTDYQNLLKKYNMQKPIVLSLIHILWENPDL